MTDGWFGIKSRGSQLEREKHNHTLQVLRSSSPGGSNCSGPWAAVAVAMAVAVAVAAVAVADSSPPKKPEERIYLAYSQGEPRTRAQGRN